MASFDVAIAVILIIVIYFFLRLGIDLDPANWPLKILGLGAATWFIVGALGFANQAASLNSGTQDYTAITEALFVGSVYLAWMITAYLAIWLLIQSFLWLMSLIKSRREEEA